jgi:hypothetical protein
MDLLFSFFKTKVLINVYLFKIKKTTNILLEFLKFIELFLFQVNFPLKIHTDHKKEFISKE